MKKEKRQKAQISLSDFSAAKQSVESRLSQLRQQSGGWQGGGWRKPRRTGESPIQRIGVFEEEIQAMENTLKSMRNRLANATVTIEI